MLWNTPSVGLSIARWDDHLSGSLYFGSGPGHAGLFYAGFHARPGHYGAFHHSRYHHSLYPTYYTSLGFHNPWYYPGYYSTYYPAYGYYSPSYSYGLGRYYSYNALYDPAPVIYQFHDTDLYYADGAADMDSNGPPSPSPGAVSVFGPTSAQDQATPLEQGTRAFEAGQFEEARRWYIQAVLAFDEDAYAKLLYGVASFATGNYEVAALAIRQALTDIPELMDRPIDLHVLYNDDTTLEFHIGALTRFLSDTAQSGATFARGEGAFLLAYLHFAAGEAERGLAILDDLSPGSSTDALASGLRHAALQALRAEAVAP